MSRQLSALLMLCGCSKIIVKPGAKVITIEPAQNALSMERVVNLFATVFEQICGSQEIGKLALERFRTIFLAAKDYGPLVAGYEKWEIIKGRLRGFRLRIVTKLRDFLFIRRKIKY